MDSSSLMEMLKKNIGIKIDGKKMGKVNGKKTPF
jgi:hypothetical protein